MKLTERLQMIVDMAKNSEGTIADVGTDHGWVPIYFAQKYPKRKIYAMDVRKEPLQKARANARDYGVQERIEFKLSDGLKACLGERIDTLIIAGMGGVLMERLLKEGQRCFGANTELILSPHGNPDLVRKCLHQMGFRIEYERYLKELGQCYLILYARQGHDQAYSEAEYAFGKAELTPDDSLLKEMREKERMEMESVLTHLQSLPENPGIKEKKEKLKKTIDELIHLMAEEMN